MKSNEKWIVPTTENKIIEDWRPCNECENVLVTHLFCSLWGSSSAAKASQWGLTSVLSGKLE